jgi:hypothetical protein
MSFVECLRTHTHRQYRTWIKWSERQWNEPSRTDHYIMSAIAELMIANGHKKVTTKKLILPFSFKRDNEPKPMSDDQLKMSKAVWGSRIGNNK